MKRILALILALLMALTLAACSRGGGDVTSAHNISGDIIYFAGKEDILSYSIASEPEIMQPACVDPLCEHYAPICPAYFNDIDKIVTVARDGKMPMIYVAGRYDPFITVDGEQILDEEHKLRREISEFDAETGQSRLVAYVDELRNVQNILYMDGKLYMSGNGNFINDSVVSVDVESGDIAIMEYSRPVLLLGVWNGRVYSISSAGEILSCAPDLSDVEKVLDLGVSTPRLSDHTSRGCVDGGMLYFERDAEEREIVLSVADLYALPLDDADSGERLVAENVVEWSAVGGNVYYTVVADEGTEGAEIAFDSGNVYKYDGKTGESSLIISDSGVAISNMIDVSDKYLFISGRRYKEDMPDDKRYFAYGLLSVETGGFSLICADLLQ